MCRVKYFVNTDEPDALPLAEQMTAAGVDFACVPTSGPLALWVDGRALYGPTAVRHAVGALVRSQRSQRQPRQAVAF